jgi:hypothetical protein
MCLCCLHIENFFSSFDVNNLARLVEIYDEDFSYYDRAIIKGQLETHILRVRRHATFSTCKYTASLAQN